MKTTMTALAVLLMGAPALAESFTVLKAKADCHATYPVENGVYTRHDALSLEEKPLGIHRLSTRSMVACDEFDRLPADAKLIFEVVKKEKLKDGLGSLTRYTVKRKGVTWTGMAYGQ